MSLALAIVTYDLSVLVILALEFVLVSRHNAKVVAKTPVGLIAVSLALHAWQVSEARLEFLAVGAGVMLTALFGYFNFLAFVKRGVTLSILHNHGKPAAERRRDSDFIAIDQRIGEMQRNGWIAGTGEHGYLLTAKGVLVMKVRRVLLRALRIKAVG